MLSKVIVFAIRPFSKTNYMKKLLLSFAVAAVSFGALSAQTLVEFGSSSSQPTPGTAPGVTASGIVAGPGVTVNSGSTFNYKGWPTTSSPDPSDFYQWSVNPGGSELTLACIDLRYDRSNSGPKQVEVIATVDGTDYTVHTDASVSSGSENVTIDLSTLPATTGEVVFKLYAFDANSSGGTFDIETYPSYNEEYLSGNAGIIVKGTLATPLPVTFGSISAKAEGNASLISWTTYDEVNNAGFEVQRSVDGGKWSTIGKVAGNGTTTEVNEYFFQDEKPNAGVNYYRLKQNDVDGSFAYSDVVRTVISARDDQKVFPNPVNGDFKVLNANVSIEILDASGRVLYNSTNVKGSHDISFLNSGIYYVRIDGSKVERLVKL